ncbi:hypothetical protein [Glycomyces arizonensis]|uniref:hypothetical protein n=1 Tax=Glycomyces arizonensis TaxID=256035 RepID=UPI000415A053|nr:hypothetical protein [Glycomyces arizonensis]
MISGLKRILARVSVAAAAFVLAVGGTLAVAAPAQADSTSYTMECGLTWTAQLDEWEYAWTDKDLSDMGSCNSDWAWLKPYNAGFGYLLTVGNYNKVYYENDLIIESKHSGCQSGCHWETLG